MPEFPDDGQLSWRARLYRFYSYHWQYESPDHALCSAAHHHFYNASAWISARVIVKKGPLLRVGLKNEFACA